MSKEGEHQAVLVAESISLLVPTSGANFIDGTLGLAGHAGALLGASAPDGHLLGFDRDPKSIAIASKNLVRFTGRFRTVNRSFANLEEVVAAEHDFITPVAGILFDLGYSSAQLADLEKGLSFLVDAPLDMRLGGGDKNTKPFLPKKKKVFTYQQLSDVRGDELTAADLVNFLEERELAALLRRFGDEHEAGKIARQVVATRETAPITSTATLATIVMTVKRRRQRIHAATQTFQALRIAVNRELEVLEQVLPQAVRVLAPGGRLAIISFHSLEDRIVKRFFRAESTDCICPPEFPECRCDHKASIKIITKKPVVPSEKEKQNNPRSRSAKLRVVEKI